MAQIDIRQSLEVDLLCEMLLNVAAEPLRYVPFEPFNLPDKTTLNATTLARQASSAVIVMCTAHLWSQIVQHLRAVISPDEAYRKARGCNLQEIFKLYFLSCGMEYKKTETSSFVQLLSDMRDALVHDRPESAFDFSSRRVDEVKKWRDRLSRYLSNDEIEWLPRVREGEPATFTVLGEPAIAKFMKYPVAKMVHKWTGTTAADISNMMFAKVGQLTIAPDISIEDFDERLRFDGSFFRLWQAGE